MFSRDFFSGGEKVTEAKSAIDRLRKKENEKGQLKSRERTQLDQATSITRRHFMKIALTLGGATALFGGGGKMLLDTMWKRDIEKESIPLPKIDFENAEYPPVSAELNMTQEEFLGFCEQLKRKVDEDMKNTFQPAFDAASPTMERAMIIINTISRYFEFLRSLDPRISQYFRARSRVTGPIDPFSISERNLGFLNQFLVPAGKYFDHVSGADLHRPYGRLAICDCKVDKKIIIDFEDIHIELPVVELINDDAVFMALSDHRLNAVIFSENKFRSLMRGDLERLRRMGREAPEGRSEEKILGTFRFMVLRHEATHAIIHRLLPRISSDPHNKGMVQFPPWTQETYGDHQEDFSGKETSIIALHELAAAGVQFGTLEQDVQISAMAALPPKPIGHEWDLINIYFLAALKLLGRLPDHTDVSQGIDENLFYEIIEDLSDEEIRYIGAKMFVFARRILRNAESEL